MTRQTRSTAPSESPLAIEKHFLSSPNRDRASCMRNEMVLSMHETITAPEIGFIMAPSIK